MKKSFMIALVFIGVFISDAVSADVPPAQKAEVNHLLAFVENSHCIVNRNGDKHQADEAVKHIKRKYDYFRDDINSTEDFINLSASKSTLSGNYYTVLCPGKKTIRTQDWLMTELKHYRAKKNDDVR
jgi:peptidoglycan hydrolase CwlO-like protein